MPGRQCGSDKGGHAYEADHASQTCINDQRAQHARHQRDEEHQAAQPECPGDSLARDRHAQIPPAISAMQKINSAMQTARIKSGMAASMTPAESAKAPSFC